MAGEPARLAATSLSARARGKLALASENASAATRIVAVLDHLGLERVHLAACMSGDWGELVMRPGSSVCSLTLVAPHLNRGIPAGLDARSPPALVICGDRGAPTEVARRVAHACSGATLHVLRDYASPIWADTVADRAAEVCGAISDFIDAVERECGSTARMTGEDEGVVAGVRYRVEGAGPPLLLLPLSLAPSQWRPLIQRLKGRYCTITLGGAHLGMISLLEERGQSGYGRLVGGLVEAAKPGPGETILEVGAGSGCLARMVAEQTARANPFTATDVNGYLLAEARSLAAAVGLEDAIRFEQEDAEALSYADGRFDVAMACTVMEEGRADRMLGELARVTRTGGRVVVVTRAVDMPWWVNAPFPDELRAKLNAFGPSTGAGVGAGGCADASLYPLLAGAGLSPLVRGPQFAVYDEGERLRDVLERFVVPLSAAETVVYRNALQAAQRDGTLFVAEPFHCAIGRKH